MNYENYNNIIKNNINLFNCIKLKFKDWYKLELNFKLDNKTFDELYFYQSIDLKTWKILYTSKEYTNKELNLLNKEIEILIFENINHLKDILEKNIWFSKNQ